jgi:hypothetical protein
MEQEKSNDKITSTQVIENNPSQINNQEQQISELKELTRTLMQSVQAMQTQATRNSKFDDTMADLKATARAIMVNPTLPQQYSQSFVENCGCKDESCSCVSNDCCCFEIVLDKVRAIQPQLEPADSGDIAVPPTINELEVRIFASINGRGILVPSLSTTMGLRVGSILLGGKPGSWVSIDRVIEKVYIKKGSPKNFIVNFEAAEVDEGIERPIGFKDEFGDASGSITLDCCLETIYPPMPVDLSFEHGGTGGGVPGMISLSYYARRVCC